MTVSFISHGNSDIQKQFQRMRLKFWNSHFVKISAKSKPCRKIELKNIFCQNIGEKVWVQKIQFNFVEKLSSETFELVRKMRFCWQIQCKNHEIKLCFYKKLKKFESFSLLLILTVILNLKMKKFVYVEKKKNFLN